MEDTDSKKSKKIVAAKQPSSNQGVDQVPFSLVKLDGFYRITGALHRGKQFEIEISTTLIHSTTAIKSLRTLIRRPNDSFIIASAPFYFSILEQISLHQSYRPSNDPSACNLLEFTVFLMDAFRNHLTTNSVAAYSTAIDGSDDSKVTHNQHFTDYQYKLEGKLHGHTDVFSSLKDGMARAKQILQTDLDSLIQASYYFNHIEPALTRFPIDPLGRLNGEMVCSWVSLAMDRAYLHVNIRDDNKQHALLVRANDSLTNQWVIP